MKTKIFIVLLGLISFSLSAQLPSGLVGYYSFDNGDADIDSGTGGGDGTENGSISYVCSPFGNAAYFDGSGGDIIDFDNGMSTAISGTDDFTIAFYFKADNTAYPVSLFSRRPACSNPGSGLDMRITPTTIYIEIFANTFADRVVLTPARPSTCWTHVAITRDGTDFTAYINGVEADDAVLNGTNTLGSAEDFHINFSPCETSDTDPLEGYFDELTVFNRGLSSTEVASLYTPSGDLIDLDEVTVCYFDSIFVELDSACMSSFSWSPTTGVSNPTASETWIDALASQTYTVSATASYGCSFYDTIDITVDSICCEPDTIYINCEGGGPGGSKMGDWVEVNDTIVITDTLLISRNSVELVIPGSFTPNGDGRNDIFEIRGTGVTFLNMQVYDLWGRQVYSTYDSKAAWDGFYDGQPGQTGVYIYAIEYMIEETGTTQTRSGSFALIR